MLLVQVFNELSILKYAYLRILNIKAKTLLRLIEVKNALKAF